MLDDGRVILLLQIRQQGRNHITPNRVHTDIGCDPAYKNILSKNIFAYFSYIVSLLNG